MLAFVHIEKTAGTSLIHILRHSYFLRYMDARPFSAASAGLFTSRDLVVAKRLNPFLAAIGGHAVVPFNGLERGAPDIRYITLLRDPVRRYVSQYRHWVEKKKLDLSVEQFMERRELWNFQTRKIAGKEDPDLARRYLRERFLAVGVVEQFDEFLVMLRRAVACPGFDIRYLVQNTARDRAAVGEIARQWGDEIRRRNELDIALYDFVCRELIPEQRARYGGSFEQDLATFSRENSTGPGMVRRYVDYALRKGYIEPLTGGLRKLGGLPYWGSY